MTAAASYTGWNSGSSRMAAALPHGALILSRETGFTMWSSLKLPLHALERKGPPLSWKQCLGLPGADPLTFLRNNRRIVRSALPHPDSCTHWYSRCFSLDSCLSASLSRPRVLRMPRRRLPMRLFQVESSQGTSGSGCSLRRSSGWNTLPPGRSPIPRRPSF